MRVCMFVLIGFVIRRVDGRGRMSACVCLLEGGM
jgi:hypothetical protein